MSGGRRTRRPLIRALWLGTGFAVLAVALLPVWFPWVLKPVAQQLGLRYDRYERQGYHRFSLAGVVGRWEDTTVQAGRVEAPLPLLWLWSRARGNTNSTTAIARAWDWKVVVEAGPTNRTSDPGPTPSTNSTFRVLNQVSKIVNVLSRQIQNAEAVRGEVAFESTRLEIPVARWQNGTLNAQAQANFFPHPVTVSARPEPGTFQVRADCPSWQLSVDAQMTRETERWDLATKIFWQTNQADVAASFGPDGWWPAHGILRATRWPVPARLLPTNVYAAATASLVLNTVSNQFQLEATSDASPSVNPEFEQTPPLHLLVKAHGTTEQATIENFEAQAPWVQLKLSQALSVQRKPPHLTNDAQLSVALDLAAIPNLALTGQVQAAVQIDASEFQSPKSRFSVTASQLQGFGLAVNDAAVRGELAGPRLRLETLRARFGDGSRLDAAADANLRTREIASGQWAFSGPRPKQFVPSIPFKQLRTTGTVRGPLTNLIHAGELAVDTVQFPGLNPIDLRARWEGQHTEVRDAVIEATAGRALLSLKSSARLEALHPLALALRLESLTLSRETQSFYTLQQPAAARIKIQPATAAGVSGISLETEPLEWRGQERLIRVGGSSRWPREGAAEVTLRSFRSEDLSDWFPQPLPPVHVRALEASARWSNGPVRLEASFEGGWDTGNRRGFDARGQVRLGTNLEVQTIEIKTSFAPAVTLNGTLPFSIVPGRARSWMVADSASTIDFNAAVKALPQFSLSLGTNAELRALRPELQFTATGTLKAPSATLVFAAERLDWIGATNSAANAGTNAPRWPGLEQITVRAEIRERSVELVRLGARIEGQRLQVRGACPLSPGFWDQLLSDPKLPDLSGLSGRLQLENARISSVSRYLPDFLAPEGQVSADITLQPERNLQGAIVLTNAATRPIGKFTPLREIAATLKLSGSGAVLEGFQGQISGQPVRASGKFVIPAQGPPEYQLELKGSNVPLARSLEFLLRGKFDVAMHGQFGKPPTISGEVQLHDGLFVQHASAIMLSRPERPNLRPPYFSVTNPPFADWRMNLTVRGTRFLRIRTPIFNGVASANVNVRGTLTDPVLTGDFRADSGRVLFPFGTLQLDQAHASFDGNDPRGPDILINASGRNYRYDLRLEVSGPADGANVVFSSTPPLSSEEILLMLTAGELPRNENVFSTEARAGRLATFLGRDLLSRFSGSDSGERLIINTGENITEEGKTTYSIEYRLTDRWSIIGEYDRFSALNAAVKWRIYSH